jgi:hypothetical protein
MKTLKYELKPYPINAEEYLPTVEEIKVDNSFE